MKRLVIFLWPLLCINLIAQEVQINITNIKNHEGHIQLMVFRDAESYKNDEPEQIKRFSKKSVQAGELQVIVMLKAGENGIILLDDENDTEQMEYNVIGLPKEGFGFAGYYHRGIRRPDFEKFKFTVSKGNIRKEIRVRYF